jgi:DNA repair exonuclease SbcCD ATPase subunit
MIDLEKMAKEHSELFALASLESQIWKLEEEISEYKEATELYQEMKELADCFIVCIGIYRFTPVVAKQIIQGLIDSSDINLEAVEKEVERKWQINLKRTWEWNGKTYKHKGTDGNE